MGDFEFIVGDGPQRGARIPFPAPPFLIGSGTECQVRFDAVLVRGKHAEIDFDETGVPWVRDLTGAGLVWVNGEAVQHIQLSAGAFLRVGRLELVVRSVGQARIGPSGTMSTPTPIRQQGAAPAIEVTARRPTPLGSDAGQSGVARPASGASGLRPGFASPPELHRAEPEVASAAAHAGALAGLAAGSIVDGRYRIIAKLAAGGMGEVYKAEHVELGKTFALKVMLPDLSKDPEFVARFKREAIAASRIGQQNIVDISDFGRTQDGRFYFVMEFLEGLTLASLVHRQGALPIERAVNIGVQVARALAAAHAQHIVHRDLKPENIMLLQRPGQADFVKVLDFGVAKVAHGHGQGGQTAIGMVVGTPQYMSPEQAKALQVDARSDIYSLGLILYELVAGRPTFTGETPSIMMVKHVTEAPAPLSPGPLGEVPADLESLIFHMLAKEAPERPQSMTQVVDVLDAVWAQAKSGTSLAGVPRTATPRPGHLPTASGAYRGQSGGFRAPSSGGYRATPQQQRVPSGGYAAAQPGTAGVDDTTLPPGSSAFLSEPESPEDTLRVGRRSRTMLFAGGGGVVTLVAAGLFLSLRTPASTETAREVPPPPAEAAKVPVEPTVAALEPTKVVAAEGPKNPAVAEFTVRLESDPPKAAVLRGDVHLGTTPLELRQAKDSVVELKILLKDYKPHIQKIGFAANSTVTVKLESEKRAGPRPALRKPSDDLQDYPQEDLKDSPYK